MRRRSPTDAVVERPADRSGDRAERTERTDRREKNSNVTQGTGLRTETEFVRVEVSDEEGEAYREAMRRVGKRDDRFAGVMEQIESSKKQILHGRKVEQRLRSAEIKPE